MGRNNVSGDSNRVKFTDGNLEHIQILGGGRGKFFPEKENAHTSINHTLLTIKCNSA